LDDHANWRKRFTSKRTGRYKPPGFVALWHAYGPRSIGQDIGDLKRCAAHLNEMRNEWWRRDPKGTEQERAVLDKFIDQTDQEAVRRMNLGAKRTGKPKTSVEAIRAQRAARRSEREHEAIKDEPIMPDWMLNGNGSAETELVKRQ
jgi:hypothetical protein